ncbi:MAG: competence/damage-inducible protein A [Clostridia bacterium]|nr:competence/damage-inducible protein A [Clostridia bacterium]
MKAAILSVGTEILFGQTVNTNATYLSQGLNELGFDVLYHYTVGDNPKRLEETLYELMSKVDLIVSTGGLGPTEDDLTKETICKAFGEKLVKDERVWNEILERFGKNHWEITKNNEKQAYVPEHGTVIHNAVGSAPGFAITKDGVTIVSMPGPPREMKYLWNNFVKDYLAAFSDEKYYSLTLRTFGIGESKLETVLIDEIHGQSDPTVATYAKEGQTQLRVTSKHKDINQARKKVEDVVKIIEEKIPGKIYAYEDIDLQALVGKMLIENNLSISSAESCTGGLFASELTNVPGISKVFKESYVTYSEKAKMEILGVKQETLDKYTVVSEQVAQEMAEGLYRKTGSDVNIAITGIAGPDGGTEEKPVGTIYIGLCYKGETKVKHMKLNNNGRIWVKNSAMLNMFHMIYEAIKADA